MKRNKSTPKRPTFLPKGSWEEILRLKHSDSGELRIPAGQHDRFSEPSIVLSESLQRWIKLLDDPQQGYYRVKGPTNIQKVYKGVPGSSQSITPSGGYTTLTHEVSGQQVPVDMVYIIIDEDYNFTVGDTSIPFNSTLGKKDQYRIYAVDEHNNFSFVQRFILETTTSRVAGNNNIEVSNITTGLPDHLTPRASGLISMNWTVLSTHASLVYVRIVDTKNMSLLTTSGISPGDSIGFSVSDVGTIVGTEVGFSYEFYTSDGEVSAIVYEDFTALLDNTGPTLDGFIHNFPEETYKNDVISWSWSGGSDIDGDDLVLDIISLSGAVTNRSLGIMPGEIVPINVVADHLGLVIMRYQLRDNYAISPTGEFLSTVTVPPPNINELEVRINDLPIGTHGDIYPCDTFNIAYFGIQDTSGLNLTVTPTTETPDVIMSSTAVTPGVPVSVTVPCNQDPTLHVDIRAIISNGASQSIREDYINISPITGQECITVSRTFVKPAGVTDITVLGQGGIGESTILSGAVTYSFQGVPVTDPDMPAPYTQSFTGLSGDSQTITVTLATDTEVTIYW